MTPQQEWEAAKAELARVTAERAVDFDVLMTIALAGIEWELKERHGPSLLRAERRLEAAARKRKEAMACVA